MKTTFIISLVITSSWVNAFGQDSTSVTQNSKSPIYWLFDAHYRMAVQYNDFDEAKSALYNLVLIEPQNDSLRYNLAYLYYDAGKYPSSILACKDILAMNPNHLGALELSGVSYENLGLKDKALVNYEKLYMKTSNLNSLYKMAFLQYDLKKYAECNVNIDLLLEKKELNDAKVVFDEDGKSVEYPMQVAVLNLKGLVKKAQGHTAEAKKAFEDALAIAPGFALAKKNLAEIK